MNKKNQIFIFTIFSIIFISFVTGCATEPSVPSTTPFKQVSNETVHYSVPKLTLVSKKTHETQSKKGMIVKIKPISYQINTGYQIRLEQESSSSNQNSFLSGLKNTLLSDININGQSMNSPTQLPVYSYLESHDPVAGLNPNNLSFYITVTNNTDYTIKINPRITVFIDSRGVEGARFSMSIPAGNTQTAILTGPPSNLIFQGNSNGTLLLKLHDMTYDPMHPSRKLSFKWFYSYDTKDLDKTEPVMQRSVQLTPGQAQAMNGRVVF